MRVGAAGGHVLGERLGVVGVEPVGRDRGGVDEALHARPGRGGEDVARSLQVDPTTLLRAAHDDESQVHHHVGLGHQVVDGLLVEHVALAVCHLVPAALGGVEGSPGQSQDPGDLTRAIQGADHRTAELAGRPGYGYGQAGSGSYTVPIPVTAGQDSAPFLALGGRAR